MALKTSPDGDLIRQGRDKMGVIKQGVDSALRNIVG